MRNAQNRNQLPLSKLRLFLISRRRYFKRHGCLPRRAHFLAFVLRVRARLFRSTDLASFPSTFAYTFAHNVSYYDINYRKSSELLQAPPLHSQTRFSSQREVNGPASFSRFLSFVQESAILSINTCLLFCKLVGRFITLRCAIRKGF